MNFTETYQRLNAPIAPSPPLIEKTLAKARRPSFPRRRLIGIAAAAAVLLATPATICSMLSPPPPLSSFSLCKDPAQTTA